MNDPFIPVPTPTPWIGSEQLPVTMPDIGLWDYADDAIQIYNKTNEYGLMNLFQIVILIGIIVAIALLTVKLINLVTNDD